MHISIKIKFLSFFNRNTSTEKPLYETSYIGFWIKVFPNRVEFKAGVGSQNVPINQIASIQLGMMGYMQITIETTGDKENFLSEEKRTEGSNLQCSKLDWPASFKY